jgi:hypothetical protein
VFGVKAEEEDAEREEEEVKANKAVAKRREPSKGLLCLRHDRMLILQYATRYEYSAHVG